MARFDLNELIHDFSAASIKTQVFNGVLFYTLKAYAYHPELKDGAEHISSLKIAYVAGDDQRHDELWHDTRLDKKRIVIMQAYTHVDFRGNGISGKLIEMANETSKERYNTPLSTSTSFLPNSSGNGSFASYPGKRIFEKLEQEGKAIYYPIQRKARWVMK